MMRMRFPLIVLLALVVLGLTGCSKEPAEPAATPEAASAPETVAAEPVAVAARAPVDIEKGKAIYALYCAGCHAAGTKGHGGTMRLAIRLGEDKADLLERDDLVDVYVKTVIREGLNMMPPFRPTEINAADLDAVTAYIIAK